MLLSCHHGSQAIAPRRWYVHRAPSVEKDLFAGKLWRVIAWACADGAPEAGRGSAPHQNPTVLHQTDDAGPQLVVFQLRPSRTRSLANRTWANHRYAALVDQAAECSLIGGKTAKTWTSYVRCPSNIRNGTARRMIDETVEVLRPHTVINLMDALRKSLEAEEKAPRARSKVERPSNRRRVSCTLDYALSCNQNIRAGVGQLEHSHLTFRIVYRVHLSFPVEINGKQWKP